MKVHGKRMFQQLSEGVFPEKNREAVPRLAVLYFVTLAFVLMTTHSSFTVGALVITTFAFLAYLACPLAAGHRTVPSVLTLETALPGLWLIFSVSLLIRSGVSFTHMNFWFVLLKVVLAMNCICAAAYSALLYSKREVPRLRLILLSSALVLVASCFFLTLKASPTPFIDVFTIFSKAADLLRSGHNPYDFLYADIYGGKYTYRPRLICWPIVTYIITLSKLLAGDVRAGYILAHLITAAGIFLLGRRWGWTLQKSFLAILVWFTFPVSLFVLGRAWVEILIMPPLLFFLYFADQRKWIGAAVMAGLACATKQYMIFFAIFSFLYVWRKEGCGKAFGFGGVASLTMLSTMLPFLFWNGRVFLDRTIFEILRYDIRTDSLSWIPFSINQLHVPFNHSLTLTLKVALSIPALAVIFWRREVHMADLMFTQVVVYSTVFLLGNQAFWNYYYFLSFFLFLQIILQIGEKRLDNTLSEVRLSTHFASGAGGR
jgi:hypothetical protein